MVQNDSYTMWNDSYAVMDKGNLLISDFLV